MSSSSSSSLYALSPPDHLSPTDQLCYLNCNFCFTVLAVSVPSSSLFKTAVTIRCGHCSNILTANTRTLVLPSAANQLQLGHSFYTPQNLLEEIRSAPPSMLINHPSAADSVMQLRGGGGGGIIDHTIQQTPLVNRPPEKRQRVPSAYNRFIKEEIQRIKAGNPDISHREAFSAAAKNWAHFPHIHFGLMPDQPVKRPTMCQQEGDDLTMRKDGLFSSANLGVSPY